MSLNAIYIKSMDFNGWFKSSKSFEKSHFSNEIVIRSSFEIRCIILRPIHSSVQHIVTISSISVTDDIQCGGPSPLGAGLLLTVGTRGAGIYVCSLELYVLKTSGCN